MAAERVSEPLNIKGRVVVEHLSKAITLVSLIKADVMATKGPPSLADSLYLEHFVGSWAQQTSQSWEVCCHGIPIMVEGLAECYWVGLTVRESVGVFDTYINHDPLPD